MCYYLLMDIRQIIRDRMAEQDISQRRLHRLTGVHQVRISNYLTGQRDMGSDNVAKLLDTLGLVIKPMDSNPAKRKGQ